MSPDTPIFVKTYDWSLWIFQKTAGFPKRFRHSLIDRIERDTLDLERALIEANIKRGQRRMAELDAADAILNALRLNMRRCFDLKLLCGDGYEFAAKSLNVIGNLLGAWKRSTLERSVQV